ncbi:hypothetical protein AX769_17650 [Frondihabitans sp. PAMC 28766]|nr:hypothetical protein AX769_17650 [Frondihabitans sp. PAMC 28766]
MTSDRTRVRRAPSRAITAPAKNDATITATNSQVAANPVAAALPVERYTNQGSATRLIDPPIVETTFATINIANGDLLLLPCGIPIPTIPEVYGVNIGTSQDPAE